MTSEDPRPDRCSAECRDGNYCENYPVGGSDRCRMHGGQSTGGTGPPGNQNATRHGLYADPANVLDDLAENDPEAYEWVEKKHDSYLKDAPFQAGTAKADKLKLVCVREYVIWKATGFQLEAGVVVATDEPDGTKLGDRIAENSVNLPLDRMERTVIRQLEKLGILDDPESQRAMAEASKVDAIREMMYGIDGQPEDDRGD